MAGGVDFFLEERSKAELSNRRLQNAKQADRKNEVEQGNSACIILVRMYLAISNGLVFVFKNNAAYWRIWRGKL